MRAVGTFLEVKNMERKNTLLKFFLRVLSYLLVAALASAITLFLWGIRGSKLTEVQQLIDTVFIGEYDADKLEDAAANAMILFIITVL